LDLIALPYDSAAGKSFLSRLIEELTSGKWDRFRAGIAFARVSGNVEELLDALEQFAKRGGNLSLTFGADAFGVEAEGSDYEAIKVLTERLDKYPSARVYLYHETGRTFHPKVFLFENLGSRMALLVLGSSNWSRGGLFENVEIVVLLELDLADEAHKEIYDKIDRCFELYWTYHE
jgi:HKD family nuclease